MRWKDTVSRFVERLSEQVQLVRGQDPIILSYIQLLLRDRPIQQLYRVLCQEHCSRPMLHDEICQSNRTGRQLESRCGGNVDSFSTGKRRLRSMLLRSRCQGHVRLQDHAAAG